MAKTIYQLPNGLRVKYIKKPEKYYLYEGNHQISIDDEYQKGFEKFWKAIIYGDMLIKTDNKYNYTWG